MACRTGFLLTRQWREQDDGLTFHYWLHTADGPLHVTLTGQEAVAFFPQARQTAAQALLAGMTGWRIRPLALKSFADQPVCGLYTRSLRTLQRCRDLFADAGITLWEADIRPVDRYLSERFIAGDLCLSGQQSPETPDGLLNPRLQPAPRDDWALRVVSLDIETAFNGSQLFSIAVHAGAAQQVWMRGRDEELAAATDLPVVACADETELLTRFLDWLEQYDPDILIGWNVVNFDLAFLQQRCDRLHLPFRLGRHRELPEWRQTRDESQHRFILVPGRVVLDGIDTLKAATWQFESYALEQVARQLLGRGKLIQDAEDRGAEIEHLFQHDKPALARYNLEDCRLVSDIFARADLLHFAVERARLTGLPLDRVGGSVAAFENLYLPRLHRAGYVAPNLGECHSDIVAPGGHVMQSRPGLYEHVLVLDFKSLYPSIIRTFCIDPLSLLKGQQEGDLHGVPPDVFRRPPGAPDSATSDGIPGYHGARFSKHHHLLPDIIRQLWQARDAAKKAGNQPLSQAIKIIMNSFYGVLGTPLCRFFDPRLSSAITLRGHDILRQTRALIEQQGHPVIYGDTDSVFVWLQGVRDDAAVDTTGRQLAAFLNDWWRDCLRQRFGLESCLEIQYETHYRRFFMPTMRGSETGSKKRYAGLVQTGEGEKLVFKGLENVRTDWTPLARRIQHDVYWKLFHDEDVQAYLHAQVQALLAGQLDEELVYRKRIRRRLADYRKNVPPHAQAARKADHWRLQQGLPRRYERGGWIRYVMTVNGPEPQECRESPLDYDHYRHRQIAPAVDGILHCHQQSLSRLVPTQFTLF